MPNIQIAKVVIAETQVEGTVKMVVRGPKLVILTTMIMPRLVSTPCKLF